MYVLLKSDPIMIVMCSVNRQDDNEKGTMHKVCFVMFSILAFLLVIVTDLIVFILFLR